MVRIYPKIKNWRGEERLKNEIKHTVPQKEMKDIY
jgi:hypothetical protein